MCVELELRAPISQAQLISHGYYRIRRWMHAPRQVYGGEWHGGLGANRQTIDLNNLCITYVHRVSNKKGRRSSCHGTLNTAGQQSRRLLQYSTEKQSPTSNVTASANMGSHTKHLRRVTESLTRPTRSSLIVVSHRPAGNPAGAVLPLLGMSLCRP